MSRAKFSTSIWLGKTLEKPSVKVFQVCVVGATHMSRAKFSTSIWLGKTSEKPFVKVF